MTQNHEEVCTILGRSNEGDDYLRRRVHNVDMHLFHSSPRYRAIVNEAAQYIQLLATTERRGYKKPHGFSAANAGIGWNIIALADGQVMINPVITASSGEKESLSNCGSLLLPAPIRIKRYAHVSGFSFNMDGRRQIFEGYLPTVQHEIDHNNGILITDRVV